jgi:multiple antibiotic resistance protein
MDEFLRATVSLFAVIDPLGSILVFDAATRKASQGERRQAALLTVSVAFFLLTLFTLAGNEVLEFLDISAASFQIAAGVLLVFPALRLVERGDPLATPAEGVEVSPLQAAIVPLAIPLLAGPAALATATAYATRYGTAETIAAVATVLGITLVLFLAGAWILEQLGQGVLRAVARMIGVLLMAIAVDLIATGVLALE